MDVSGIEEGIDLLLHCAAVIRRVLEIRKEILIGELANPAQAALALLHQAVIHNIDDFVTPERLFVQRTQGEEYGERDLERFEYRQGFIQDGLITVVKRDGSHSLDGTSL